MFLRFKVFTGPRLVNGVVTGVYVVMWCHYQMSKLRAGVLQISSPI